MTASTLRTYLRRAWEQGRSPDDVATALGEHDVASIAARFADFEAEAADQIARRAADRAHAEHTASALRALRSRRAA